jgi:hypothetical protein
MIITPLHVLYLKHCIISKYYRRAQKTLLWKTPKYDLTKFKIHIQDYLLFFHYSGIISLALEEFKQAYTFFGFVLVAPASVPSLIMIDSCKKYILTSIILFRKLNPINILNKSHISRSVKLLVSHYIEFADIFEKNNDFSALLRHVEKHSNEFQEDGNVGLIDYCINSYVEKNVQQFSNTYLTLEFPVAYSLLKSSLQNSQWKYSKYDLEHIENFEFLVFNMASRNIVKLGIDKSLNTLNLDNNGTLEICAGLTDKDLETIRNTYFKIKERELELMKSDKFLKQYVSDQTRSKASDEMFVEQKS